MVDQDLVFRAGLLLAVLTLAGIFGSSVASRMSKEVDSSLEDISSQFREIITAVHTSEPGSSITISFGKFNDDARSKISLPERIDGKKFDLNFHHGLVWMEHEGEKEIVLQGDWILPSFKPLNSGVILRDLSDGLSSISSGFQMKTPCEVRIEKPEGSAMNEVFLYPYNMENDPVIPRADMCANILDDPGQLLPGWSRTTNISGEDVLFFNEQMIVVKPGGSHTTSGICPIPIIIYGNVEIIEKGQGTGQDLQDLIIVKEAALQNDGTVEIDTRIIVEYRL